jgi:predicted nucleotidyltransferase
MRWPEPVVERITPHEQRTSGHSEHRRSQDEILRAVLRVCAADPNVLGVTATGSYARGQNDGFSDLDVAVYFADDGRTGSAALHKQVSEVAPTLCVLYLYDEDGLYLFHHGVRLDLTYKPRGAVRIDPSEDARIIHDPEGVLTRELGTQYRPTPPSHPRFFEMGDPAYVRWFLWMFRQVYGWAGRAAQGDRRAFDKLFDAAASLQVIRTSLLEMGRWTLGSRDYFGVADPITAAELVQTFGPLVPSEVQAATRLLLGVYERICPAYCERAGIDFPVDDVARLRRVLDELDAL